MSKDTDRQIKKKKYSTKEKAVAAAGLVGAYVAGSKTQKLATDAVKLKLKKRVDRAKRKVRAKEYDERQAKELKEAKKNQRARGGNKKAVENRYSWDAKGAKADAKNQGKKSAYWKAQAKDFRENKHNTDHVNRSETTAKDAKESGKGAKDSYKDAVKRDARRKKGYVDKKKVKQLRLKTKLRHAAGKRKLIKGRTKAPMSGGFIGGPRSGFKLRKK